MNRKLHNKILAFSVTGVMLFIGMVVAEPALERQEVPVLLPTVVVHPGDEDRIRRSPLQATLDSRIEARAEARAKAFEAEIARTASTGEALALTAGFLAATATEAALIGALSELDKARVEGDLAAGVDEAVDDATATAPQKGSRARDVIAVPYFSFARGSHRGSRS